MSRKITLDRRAAPLNLSVDVVISVYNGGDTLSQCLASLATQRRKPQKIIVVNDASTDNTSQVLQRFRYLSNLQIVELTKNVGTPAARNLGVARSQSELVAFIDADACAPPVWLEELVAPFSNLGVTVVGGPDQAPADSTPFQRAIDYSLQSILASGRLRLLNPFAPYSPAGCNLAIRRAIFSAAGGFDERLDRRGEDKELLQRLRRRGHPILMAVRACIFHRRRSLPSAFLRQNYLSGVARIDILRLAPDALTWVHLAPGLLVILVTGAVSCHLMSAASPICSGVILAYLLTLLADTTMAALTLRAWRPTLWVPLANAAIHWGYGVGLLHGAWRWLWGLPVGSGAATRVPELRG